MLTSGDVLLADLGQPVGREAGYPRPVVVVTAQVVLTGGPSVVHVVPFTTTLRQFRSEVVVQPDPTNGLDELSAAQCQHVRGVAVERLGEAHGNVGPVVLAEIRETIVVDTSAMPAHLLDNLRAEEILDLMAYLESGRSTSD